MPRFSILIDDGECITSELAAAYPNMLLALADTLRTAAIIAGERVPTAGPEQDLVCEVQDYDTRERRHMAVRFEEVTRSMMPLAR